MGAWDLSTTRGQVPLSHQVIDPWTMDAYGDQLAMIAYDPREFTT